MPPSVAPPGLVARARVTLPVKVGSTFPKAILGRDDQAEAAAGGDAAGGWVVTTSWVAAAAVTVMAPVVAALRPPPDAWSVSPVAGLVERQAGERRHAGAGVDGEVPPSVAPLGLVASARVTLPVKLGSTFPKRILGRDDQAEAAAGGDAAGRLGRHHELRRRRGGRR